MKVFRLSADARQRFDKRAEDGPGFHISRLDGEPVLVVFSFVVLSFDTRADEPLEMSLPPWLAEGATDFELIRGRFDEWLKRLTEVSVSPTEPEDIWLARQELYRRPRGFVLFTPILVWPSKLAPPAPLPLGYGHLPFSSQAKPGDVFYRNEAFPRSGRIDQQAKRIVSGTFAVPISEIRLVPTEFSAVARYALPSIFPVCFRWELRPPAKTLMKCGSVIPYFGQSAEASKFTLQSASRIVARLRTPSICRRFKLKIFLNS